MKNLVIGLISVLAISGCATKSDLQSSNAALEQRLQSVEVNEACHGKTLELFLFSMELRAAMSSVASQEQADAITQAQLTFMVMQGDQQAACKKLEALRKKQDGEAK